MEHVIGTQTRSVNPFLPSTEFIPDGEPRVFGDRVYLYGSHDEGAGAKGVCAGDYVCYSAPVDDLAAWRFDGVIYPRMQDPYVADRVGRGKDGINAHLFAPDVIEVDGRYLMYYGVGLSASGFGLAVAPSPTGPFEYVGRLRYPDGRVFGDGKGAFSGGRLRIAEYPYDPAMLHHDGRLFLYFGLLNCSVIELDPADGLTVIRNPDTGRFITPILRATPLDAIRAARSGRARRTVMVNGPSIREVDGRFVLSYWAMGGEEFSGMYHAISVSPSGPFTPAGPLVALGNGWLNEQPGATDRRGNTHGGMFRAGDTWYQVYHRHTADGRQACAVPLRQRADGGFEQSEYTSQGLDASPLDAFRTWPAYIACHLVGRGRRRPAIVLREHPSAPVDPETGRPLTQVVSDTRAGSVVGFKYLDFRAGAAQTVTLSVDPRSTGRIEVCVGDPDAAPVATVVVATPHVGRGWIDLHAPVVASVDGVQAVYLRFHPDRGELGDVAALTFTPETHQHRSDSPVQEETTCR
ncbi:family 43 glycosylhydrolase [Microbacterium sp. B2969]|uniref:Family 43 glycosylhydrolase n=1 Tax=Microbacterium alkaliflavum TaxID=3248839 RepID=A0ABW7Q298_9MICO